MRLSATILILSIAISPLKAQAWGKRGHALVCSTAAYLLARQPQGQFLKDRSFDLEYYCNVPDLVWKRPTHYQQEWFNHFMDMEIFDREFKDPEMKKAALLKTTREEFAAQHPGVADSAGRSFWRIDELMARATKITEQLKNKDLAREEKHRLQADWLVTAGAIGHYVGDLSQPLHVTENYDGQLTDQKGVHVWFEDEIVNELYLDAGRALEDEIMQTASKKWAKLNLKNKLEAPLREDLFVLAEDSNQQLKKLLKIDKDLGRKNLPKASAAYRAMVIDRIATGAAHLALMWNRQLGWDFDSVKFFTFVSDPEFIPTGKSGIEKPLATEPSPSPTAAMKK
jgi:hypothetical protein